jgi:hypothetical protein
MEGSPMSEIVLCTYRVKPGCEDTLLGLFRAHDVVLRELDLITEEPAVCYRGADDQGRPFFVKTFTWRSARAVEAAHQHPEVASLWERMDPLCEPRDGRPGMEFPHVERIVL